MIDEELRRRTVGAPAAESVLLTMLAEHTLPEGGSVWQETLVQCLVAVGHSLSAARQASARAVNDGWLRSERVGRRSRLHLTERSVATLSEGTEQILRFGAPRSWDGLWSVVAVTVRGEQQELRRRLRTLLAWYGFGPLGKGLWVTPWVAREHLVRNLFDAERDVTVFCFRSQLAPVSDVDQLVRTAWDLEDLHARYREFVDRFTAAAPDDPQEMFVADTELSHSWRRFLFVDPALPPELLPEDWPGRQAYDLFHALNARWRPVAHEHYLQLEARIGIPTAETAGKPHES